jgi:hypothetical protein
MVLHPRVCGRVGRRPIKSAKAAVKIGAFLRLVPVSLDGWGRISGIVSIMISRLALVSLTTVLFAPVMHAGLVTFLANGQTTDGSLLTGTVVIDTGLGNVSSLALTLTGPSAFAANTVESSTGPTHGPAVRTLWHLWWV